MTNMSIDRAELLRAAKPTRDPEIVVAGYLRFYGLGHAEVVMGRSVARALVRPRQEIFWFLRELTHLSLPAIGAAIGGRDHTTVVHGISRISDHLASSSEYRAQMQKVKAYILAFDRTQTDPLNDAATVLARRVLAHHCAEGGDPDLAALAVSMVSVAAILRSNDLTDAEARFAALTIITNARGNT